MCSLFFSSSPVSRSYSYWVGANDHEQEGDWVWMDGRSVPSNIWGPGQPNEMKLANCMEIRPGFKFVAVDEDCRVPKYFVCQQRGT